MLVAPFESSNQLTEINFHLLYNSKFVDSSGSGDVFFAHFIESILKEKSLLNSINYASKFATKNVSHFGYDIFWF